MFLSLCDLLNLLFSLVLMGFDISDFLIIFFSDLVAVLYCIASGAKLGFACVSVFDLSFHLLVIVVIHFLSLN